MKIGIDLDGVVIDSETTFRTYEEIFDIDTLKGNNLINKEEPKFQARYDWTNEQEKEFIEKYFLKVSKESNLMSGFIGVYNLLKSQGHEFVVITARGGFVKEINVKEKMLMEKLDNNQIELWSKLNGNNTLQEVQQYIKEVIKVRGFAEQEIEKTMLLLLEEVGELAKSIRKNATDMGIDNNKANHYDTIESEVADVFIVLCSVCNKLDIDLYKSLKYKEKENIMRIWKKEK